MTGNLFVAARGNVNEISLIDCFSNVACGTIFSIKSVNTAVLSVDFAVGGILFLVICSLYPVPWRNGGQ